MHTDERRETVRQLAARHGFDLCRITRPQFDDLHAAALRRWVGQGMQGEMAWMAEEGRLARRSNPAELLDGVRSVICVGMRYSPPSYTLEEAARVAGRGVISAYAHGADYHDVMKARLKAMARDLDAMLGEHAQRVFVDTAPVLEHALAERAGIGWQGKHSLTLNRQMGSWFLLGELFTTVEIEADEPSSFHCGSCRACIDSCPTGAIVSPFVVDARLCISYLTIEHKGFIARGLRIPMGNRIYGCDDCQLACPWNGDIEPVSSDFLAPRGENCLPELASLLVLDDTAFRSRFAKSPIKRVGRNRFVRNCCIAAGNSGDISLLPLLLRLAEDDSAVVRAHAVWALGRLCEAADAADMLSTLTSLRVLESDAEVCEEFDLTIGEIRNKL